LAGAIFVESQPVEVLEPDQVIADITSTLTGVEGRLIALTREAAYASRPLSDIVTELVKLQDEIRPQYKRLQETLERRDLTFETVTNLETQRRRAIWLYRRSRLEQVFFAKLDLERSVRDTLYREILETYDQMAELDMEDRRLREVNDTVLVSELVQKTEDEE
jgi:hypothetical protein